MSVKRYSMVGCKRLGPLCNSYMEDDPDGEWTRWPIEADNAGHDLRRLSFTVLGRLQSGEEEVVRLDDALASVAAEEGRATKLQAKYEILAEAVRAVEATRVLWAGGELGIPVWRRDREELRKYADAAMDRAVKVLEEV